MLKRVTVSDEPGLCVTHADSCYILYTNTRYDIRNVRPLSASKDTICDACECENPPTRSTAAPCLRDYHHTWSPAEQQWPHGRPQTIKSWDTHRRDVCGGFRRVRRVWNKANPRIGLRPYPGGPPLETRSVIMRCPGEMTTWAPRHP